jgi:bla regulator protein blaR1
MMTYSDTIVHALGLMLAHSLWQIALVATLLKIIAPVFKTAKSRYSLFFGALCLVLVVSGYTFWSTFEVSSARFLESGVSPYFSVKGENAIFSEKSTFSLKLMEESSPSFLKNSFATWYRDYHSYIVFFWGLGAFVFLLKLLTGFYYTKKILNQQTNRVSEHWEMYFNDLLHEKKVKKVIKLLESSLIIVPCVIGYFKPVILLPIGLLNQLSEKEVEAIIVHELAHIIRKDWMLNIFQSMVEAIFYFHPAIWWISEKIREEREHCCDDYVLKNTTNQLIYAKALLHTQEFSFHRQQFAPSLAMGLDGAVNPKTRQNKFLHRIQRILNQSQVKSSIMEKITATGILLTIVTLLSLRLESAPIVNKIAEIATNPLAWTDGSLQTPLNAQISITTDTVPNGNTKTTQKISTDDGKQKIGLTLENDAITALNVDGKEIAPADFDKYKEITDRLMADLRNEKDELSSNLPPLPALPDFPDFPSSPDAPSMPPFPSSTQIITNKDDKGNTVIHLEQNGKPTEIIVKDGVVFIDGKQTENGQAIQINDEGGNSFSYSTEVRSPDGKTRKVIREDKTFVIMEEDMKKEHERMMEQHEKAMEDMEKDMKKHEEDMKMHEKDMKQHEKDMKKHNKEMRIVEKKIIKEQGESQKSQEEEMKIIKKEMKIVNEDIENAEKDSKQAGKKIIVRGSGEPEDDFAMILKQELKKDKLIKGNAISFELSKESLVVNGEKQSDTVQKKYLELFEKTTGNKLSKGNKVVIQED